MLQYCPHEELQVNLVFLDESDVVFGQPTAALQVWCLDVGIEMVKSVSQLNKIVVGSLACGCCLRRGRNDLNGVYGVIG